ncbi:hypothetical protein CY34DRAFT_19555 [Suillus luteus UH-Slu-Lm8-n1]|uniref:Uncharacterized protein n=1 Tax=Suillus luteus UH-Slu-Lm8-n1 TaxID=930992 RepID=A0A0D0AIF5_9AGAM|nr:hypothetical protein CY34DRAFT_19555 [Suillus luteus UH-Slu-Lm8-n1]
MSWGYHGLDHEGSEEEEKEKTLETGREVSRLATDATYHGTPATQVNRIVSHPTTWNWYNEHVGKK